MQFFKGKIPDGLNWHQYFLQLLYDRIAASNETSVTIQVYYLPFISFFYHFRDAHEIRYNLMALVPRRWDKLKQSFDLLEANRVLLLDAIKSVHSYQ